MTQRYSELLKADCLKFYETNQEICKKWGQTTQSIFDKLMQISKLMESVDCPVKFIHETVRKDLANIITLIREGKTPNETAEQHIKEYKDKTQEGQIAISEVDDGLFKKRAWTKEEDERLILLYKQGIATEKIAKFLHVTISAIDSRLVFFKKKHRI